MKIITTGAVRDVVTTQVSNIVDSIVFLFCLILLFLLGIYIFFISPKKSKTIRKQEQQIIILKRHNKLLKKLNVAT